MKPAFSSGCPWVQTLFSCFRPAQLLLPPPLGLPPLDWQPSCPMADQLSGSVLLFFVQVWLSLKRRLQPRLGPCGGGAG